MSSERQTGVNTLPVLVSINPYLNGHNNFSLKMCGQCAPLFQSCPTLCDPKPWGSVTHSPPASSVHGFSRQEYGSGLPCPSPGDLPNPGIEPVSVVSPALQAGSLPIEPPGKPIVAKQQEQKGKLKANV